jgi:hypothetical protein
LQIQNTPQELVKKVGRPDRTSLKKPTPFFFISSKIPKETEFLKVVDYFGGWGRGLLIFLNSNTKSEQD